MQYFYIWLGFSVVLFVLNIGGTVFFKNEITVFDLMIGFFGSLFGPVGLLLSLLFLLDKIESNYGSITIWSRKK